jgi:23S rRNA (uracil1939-C5)-methyltransferase
VKKPLVQELILDKIVGGGQALGAIDDGRKAFVWGALPGEKISATFTKTKKNYVDGIANEIIEPSDIRVEPRDPDSYLSTSPWQIMDFDAEQHYKSALIEEAFELHDIVLPDAINVYSDNIQYGYRNKVEFSWWWDNDTDQLDLAFFRRGTHGKIPVESTSLARVEINECAQSVRDVLRTRNTEARSLKTLMVRCDQSGNCVFQLYVKDKPFEAFSDSEIKSFKHVQGWEVIYSDPRSPASRITERLHAGGNVVLSDMILDVPFRYACEGFFQVNLPIYEKTLTDMREWVSSDKVIDLYSGVGSIGLTIGGDNPTLIEIDEHAVREMKSNVTRLKRSANVVHASAETALNHLSADATIIVDPPRAGLHEKVIEKLLELKPSRIIYLSCNPVTQARDVARLAEIYGIRHHQGYNFFPRTPHIEHLVILDAK